MCKITQLSLEKASSISLLVIGPSVYTDNDRVQRTRRWLLLCRRWLRGRTLSHWDCRWPEQSGTRPVLGERLSSPPVHSCTCWSGLWVRSCWRRMLGTFPCGPHTVWTNTQELSDMIYYKQINTMNIKTSYLFRYLVVDVRFSGQKK